MTQVYLSIGSNIERNKNIRACIQHLRQDYPDIVFSNIYETPAFGFDGNPFYNLAAGLSTEQSLEQLQSYLKNLESTQQRQPHTKKFSARTLDVDILLFGDLILQPNIDIPRKEITLYNFVLYPLQEIAAKVIHPELKISIHDLAKQSSLPQDTLKLITL